MPDAQRAEIARRRSRAVQLRLAGVAWQTIADQLGYSSPQAAHKDVQRAYEQAARDLADDVDRLRSVELDRLDRMQAGMWSRAISGDDKAVLSVLRIMGRRARLLGLDAPVKVRAEVTTEFDREVEDLVARLTGARRQPDTNADDRAGVDELGT